MVKLSELRKRGAAQFEKVGVDSPRADADFLLTKLFGLTKGELLLGDRELDEGERAVFEGAIERRLGGEPVQYIAGKCEFMSLDFAVTRATLIPRSDTEILVETVIDEARRKNAKTIFEIGCGSGCIAVSLAYYLPNVRVFTADISKDALSVAAENAKRHGVFDRVSLLEHDIMKGFPTDMVELPDIIVSNPPYIPRCDIEGLDKKVCGFEPMGALDGGEDGLDFYRKICECARLCRGGMLAFEVGIGQAVDCAELMKKRFSDIIYVKDLSGIDRVVTGIFEG